MNRAKIIGVLIEAGEADLFHATSPDMPELLVSGESIEDVKTAVPAVIEAIFKAHGSDVSVVEAESDDAPRIPAPWVIIPQQAIQKAC